MRNDLLLTCQRLTSVTVKVRRLGYIVSIPSLVKEYQVPQRILKKQIKDWAEENRIKFKHYSLQLKVDRKRKLVGEIRTISAAGRYLNTAEEIGLVTDTKNIQISKVGRVISTLCSEENPFDLSIGQNFLLLRLLLEKDYDNLKTLRKTIVGQAEDETEFFRRELISRLFSKLEKATEMNKLLLVDKLKKSIQNVRRWKSAKRYYFENIKAPRLEWLIDLGLLSYWNVRSNEIVLRESVGEFFEKEMLTKEWLYNVYPYKFGIFMKECRKKVTKEWKEVTSGMKSKLLKSLLGRSMSLFEPIYHLGRISADQFFDYTQAILLEEKGIIASIFEIEQSLMDFVSSGKTKIQYVQTVSQADRGYILRA